MIEAIKKESLGELQVPGATVRAWLATDARGRREVWLFVHSDDGRRTPTLLHMSPEDWEALIGFLATVHRALPRERAKVMPIEISPRGAYR